MSSDRHVQGVFMISVAAELAGMHPQTLRVYERRGLITPQRTPRNTRLYSQADVELLQRIQALSEEGLNLAGIERVLDLEGRLARAERRVKRLETALAQAEETHEAELRALAQQPGAALVQYTIEETSLVPAYAPVVRGTARKGSR
ncbi:MAG: heat shock protein transcriptional repressor HspR [Miltoncostaeaceae bacterium]